MEGKNLVIVESPGKVKTIQKFLGDGFLVKASIGHIRDLQEKKLSVDIQKGFLPEYVIPADKKKVVAELKKLSSEAKAVWLASDEDREGEAISWHLFETLGLKSYNTRRIVFHEITRDAILEAIKNPRDIDMRLVNAQQARRVLDRLVGFELSPILWRKIQPKLSAGRVQSVALRLVVDREKEIMAFTSESFFKAEARFRPSGMPSGTRVKAVLDKLFHNETEARAFIEDVRDAEWTILSEEHKEATRMPSAPFTTSTLQQEAARKLHFPVGTTMRVAQTLYEKGLITYMRTDSTNLSQLAVGAIKNYITSAFGAEYSKPRQFRTKSKGAQEAHEAIRPTYINNIDIEGSSQEKKLYQLIWKRTIASQMAEGRVMNTSIRVGTNVRPEQFVIQAARVLFDGFLKVYLEGRDDEESPEGEVILPDLHIGDIMNALQISAESKFTSAPPRYSEATLVKKLEELGIGRPSTYAPTISTLTTGRGYLVKGDKDGVQKEVVSLVMKAGKDIVRTTKTETVGAEKGKLLPQEIGMIVTDYLTENFAGIVDYDFTANVEKDFDEIAEGGRVWNTVIADFYAPFHRQVEAVLKNGGYSHVERELGTDPETGEKLLAKFGQYGPYVQKGEGDKRQYASLPKGILIESITLKQALALFELPRTVGELEGSPVVAMKGRFGPYISYGGKNISLPKGVDPKTVSLEECVRLIKESGDPASAVIKEFPGDIRILNGRFGPYIKQGKANYRIPKGKKPELMTEKDCLEIINNK